MQAVGSRYQRLSTLAEGPGRVTVTAQDRLLQRTCVLKLAAAEGSGAAALVAEADRLAALSHPGLVSLVDRFTALEGLDPSGPVTGFATEWVDGVPLGAKLADRPLAERLLAAGQLVEVVSYLHRARLLHLDIKPSNVLVGSSGVVLLDLGTARPVDSGVGEAGGTLGYAAPEVLQGEAAGVHADIFSLGVLLYELVSGHRPYGDLAGGALRRAMLAGDHVPLRACCPDIDSTLACHVMRMLSVGVTARPADLSEIRDLLEDSGVPVPPPRGAPPFAGREPALRALRSTLRSPGQVVVVGPRGAGRRRLVAELIGRGSTRCLDLSAEPDPRVALGRLAESLGADITLDMDDEGWEAVVASALAQEQAEPYLVYLGDRGRLSEARLAALDHLAQALVAGGGRALWVAETRVEGTVAVELDPLSGAAMLAIGQFFGQGIASRMPTMLARTGGWPGALLCTLSSAPLQVPPLAEDAWQVLSALPEGIPHAVVERLPSFVQRGLSALHEAGLVRRDADGLLYAVRVQRELPDTPELHVALVDLLDGDTAGIDPLWIQLLAARLERPVDLRPLMSGRLALPGARLDLLTELAERQVSRGDPLAPSLLAAARTAEGDHAAALLILEGLSDPDPLDRVLMARALRKSGRVAEAVVVLEQGGEALPERAALIERGRCALTTRDMDTTSALVQRLLDLPGGGGDSDTRLLQALYLDGLVKAGQAVSSVAELERWAEAHPGGQSMAMLGPLARLARARGDLSRALKYQQESVRLADQEGYPRVAIGTRVNQANLLVALGRSADARRVLDHALLLARGAGERVLMAQANYALARLDLHGGRLPDARAHLAEYDRLVQGMSQPEVHLRGALNRAWLHMLDGRSSAALEVLDAAPTERVTTDGLAQHTHLRAWALLEQGHPEQVLALLEDSRDLTRDPALAPLSEALRGRAHLALGRRHLDSAREAVEDEEQAAMQPVVGEVLLAWAGEDMDPVTFPARRQALSAAARCLRGPLAARAVRLRERMLDGPGANLDGIVALTEAMHDPQAFPEALARLVREALGAHRVLIMLRMPGLGNQVGFTELSGAQAAGIGREVMERIRRPDDVWSSGDAFADPELRESSQTVQTFELKSLLAVAIPRGEQAVGALYVDDMYRTNRFDADDVALLQRLARAVGRMIPLMREDPTQELHEPTETLGVLLSAPAHTQSLTEALEMLSASRESNILVTGPTGAGKSFMARRLAQDALDLQDIEVVVLRKGDPQMLVTQLMGSKRGEFTGATDRDGAIARSLRDRKALFLDEIQNLDETGQQILLPLLDLPRRFGTLTGSADRLKQPLQVILGTNHDVSGSRAFDIFRTDLWYRMSRIHIHLPPLEQRGAEVVYRYLDRMFKDRGGPSPEGLLETAALYRVTHAEWPGNLRELDAFAERAVHLANSRGRKLGLDDLAALRLGEAQTSGMEEPPSSRRANLDHVLIRHVMGVLRRHSWVQKTAADELGMNPPTLNKLLKRHGLIDEVRRRRHGA